MINQRAGGGGGSGAVGGDILSKKLSNDFSYILATDDLMMGSSHQIESGGIGFGCQVRYDY